MSETYKYREDLETEFQQQQVNVVIPPKKGHSDSIDFVVIDDKNEYGKVQITIENKMNTQRISIDNKPSPSFRLRQAYEQITGQKSKKLELQTQINSA